MERGQGERRGGSWRSRAANGAIVKDAWERSRGAVLVREQQEEERSGEAVSAEEACPLVSGWVCADTGHHTVVVLGPDAGGGEKHDRAFAFL